jgi:hypothetical protein
MNYRESCAGDRLEYITYYITLLFMTKKQTAIVHTEEQATKLAQLEDPNHIRAKFAKIGEMEISPKAIYKK